MRRRAQEISMAAETEKYMVETETCRNICTWRIGVSPTYEWFKVRTGQVKTEVSHQQQNLQGTICSYEQMLSVISIRMSRMH